MASRQRIWQLKRARQGKCGICGEPAKGLRGYCDGCRENKRIRLRNAYRSAKGIALDAPLSNRGRPRKYA